MGKIDININRTELETMTIEFKREYPEVKLQIGLYAGEKRITSISVGTKYSWAEVPMDINMQEIDLIVQLKAKMEIAATLACSSAVGYLEAPKAPKAPPKPKKMTTREAIDA